MKFSFGNFFGNFCSRHIGFLQRPFQTSELILVIYGQASLSKSPLMKFAGEPALKFDTVYDVHAPPRIIHGCAQNPAFCRQPLLRSSELSPKAAETDLRAGGIFTERECIRAARDKSRARSARIYCAPERFRLKSLLISIRAPPRWRTHTSIGNRFV